VSNQVYSHSPIWWGGKSLHGFVKNLDEAENAGAFFCLAQISHKIHVQLIFLGLTLVFSAYHKNRDK